MHDSEQVQQPVQRSRSTNMASSGTSASAGECAQMVFFELCQDFGHKMPLLL